MTELTPDLLLRAYCVGLFPMSEDRDDPDIVWIDPERRGIIPLDGFHIPRKLARLIRRRAFEVRCDSDFATVIRGCAESTASRQATWINDRIIELYSSLHALGRAHCVECWQEGRLVGGLYGIAIGAAFFGESMFSRANDASKIALMYLIAYLLKGGFRLLDTQFITDHLRRFGAIEVTRAQYHHLLADALNHSARFPGMMADEDVLSRLGIVPVSQSSTQIS